MRDDIAGTESGKATASSEPASDVTEADFRAYEAAELRGFLGRVGLALPVAVAVMTLVTLSYWRNHPFRVDLLQGGRIGWRVDLTTADAATLQLLPGVGPTIAGRIVELRDAGIVTRPDDLMRVTGIGRKTFDRLRPYVKDAPANVAAPASSPVEREAD